MINSDEYLFIYDKFDGIVLSTSRKLISNDYCTVHSMGIRALSTILAHNSVNKYVA